LAAFYDTIKRERPISAGSLEDDTGNGAMIALQLIHRVLSEEEASQSSALPKLGVRDLQIVQTTIAILANWRLAPRVAAFDSSIAVLQSKDVSSQAPAKLQEVPDEDVLNQRRQTVLHRLMSIKQDLGGIIDELRSLLDVDLGRSEVSNAFLHTCAPHSVAVALRLIGCPTLQKGNSQEEAMKQHSSVFLNGLLRSLSTASCLRILSASGQVAKTSSKDSKQTAVPSFVKLTTERVYSAQLLRTDAVMALLKITFGSDDDQGSLLTRKLTSFGHLFSTPPPDMHIDTFAVIVAPRLLEIVGELPGERNHQRQTNLGPSRQSTATHKTAACFALARLFEVAPSAVASTVRSHIWQYLLPDEDSKSPNGPKPSFEEVQISIDLLYQTIERSEPSTHLLSFLIAPVFIPLFTLYSFIEQDQAPTITELKEKGRASDAALASMIKSLLITWIRLADISEACDVLEPGKQGGLFSVSGTSVRTLDASSEEHFHPYWTRLDGLTCVVRRKGPAQDDLSTQLSLLDFTDLQPSLQTDDGSALAIPPSLLSAMNLAPSPTLLSSLLKESARKDLSSEILSALLQSYTLAKQSERTSSIGTMPSSTKSVLYVQHILELISAFGSEILSGQASKVLTFINFALGPNESLPSSSSDKHVPVQADALPFIQPSRGREGALDRLTSLGGKREDADQPSIEEEEPDDELVETSLNLLLSLLENDATMSMDTHTILRVIFAKVDVHASSAESSEIRALAKEAKLVLTARRSSKIAAEINDRSGANGDPLRAAYEKGNETYQEALRLLQDPILPVRAHGLIMLKELAACGSTDAAKERLMDPALTSAILDIYIQAVQDDESFLYLNAVKGLAEMANTGGRTMIKRLMHLYLGEHNAETGVPMKKARVDMQLRVGEALLQVVQKLEEALLPHVGVIVEPLLTALRVPQRSATLRSSYLSVLGTCVEACPLAFSASQLGDKTVDAMFDLLSVETVVTPSSRQQQEDMEDPIHLNSKLPQLRRAAVLLLALFIRGSRHQLDAAQEKRDNRSIDQEGLTSLRLPNGSVLGGRGAPTNSDDDTRASLLFSQGRVERASTLLSYIAATDTDALVRHQSKEVLEELHLLTLTMYAG
jgi:hypothetical protein